MLNTYASTTLMCAFCENLISPAAQVCTYCDDYKGIMTIAEFGKIFFEEM